MHVFTSGGAYDTQLANPAIFLAGPTLRGDDKTKYPDWRKEALDILEKFSFDGAVYIPSPMKENFGDQVDWEVYHLENADCILFWVPRDLKILPGFTTNIEFGEWLRSGKIVLGCPLDAQKVRYLIYRAKKYNVPVAETLFDTVEKSIKMVQG